jgi:hypothetical protein
MRRSTIHHHLFITLTQDQEQLDMIIDPAVSGQGFGFSPGSCGSPQKNGKEDL